jgi:hypothetical protein
LLLVATDMDAWSLPSQFSPQICGMLFSTFSYIFFVYFMAWRPLLLHSSVWYLSNEISWAQF